MGLLKKLFGGADGIRETMRESYDQHVLFGRLAKHTPGVENVSPHHAGLYGALGTRYLIRRHSISERDLWLELAPFFAMEEQESVEALVEYAIYQERPKDAGIGRLAFLINSALCACKDEIKVQVAVASRRAPSWVSLLREETAQMLGNVRDNGNVASAHSR